jgi:hypothetical protein
MRELELSGKLLEHACRALEREMREFTLGVSMRTLQEGGSAMDEDRIKDLQDNRPKTSVWSEPEPWQKFAGDLQMIQREVQGWVGVDPVVLARVKEEARLFSTGTRLADQFREQLQEARVTPPTLEDLAQQANVLRNFTEMWTIYQVAWEQRHKGESWHPEIEEGPTLRSLRAGDRVVRDLYKVVQQDLDTIMGGQLLIVVPFMSGLYAAGFDLPTPYIISPRWGHRLVWTWLGYAHEVGHHVYRNVKGLSDELKVNVVMELWSQGEDYTVQRIWLHWVEEIFADLFGLLQIGPAFAQTQQLMLPYLPLPAAPRKVSNRLLVVADETHPIPYLRVFLAIRALEELGIPEADTKPLRDKWEKFFHEDGGVDVKKSKISARVRGSHVEIPVKEMIDVAEIVLDVILNTDLDALARKPLDSSHMELHEEPQPRKLADPDLFHEPLDERRKKVEAARQAISGVSSGGFDMRHLLAATQKSLEELSAQTGGEPSGEDIDDLNTRVINAIMEAYQESALPAV